MNKELGTRTKGMYPISIGTSVALECFFGVNDAKPLRAGESAPYHDYQCIMANLRTLARNFIGSYKAQEVGLIGSTQLYVEFMKEIILINNIVNDQSSEKVIVSFYNPTYLKLKNHLKKVKFRESLTAKQQLSLDYELMLTQRFHADLVTIKQYIAYEHTNDIIRQGKRRNVMLTHYPVDLLLTELNPNLLESHTGRIKKPYEFASKLKRAGEYVPFNKYTIQILGDSSGNIMSASSSMRQELMLICKEHGIVPATLDKRFIKVVKEHASPELRALLNGM